MPSASEGLKEESSTQDGGGGGAGGVAEARLREVPFHLGE